jgi:methylmalonyl-CoA/ethylmalonyl-CoA epimerase
MIGIEKIDHICVAVRNLEQASLVWAALLGKSEPDREYRHEPEGIHVRGYTVGEAYLEIMASTREGSEIDRFIAKKGEGIMLISFKVPDTEAAIKILIENGYAMIDQTPRVWRQSRYAFVDPKFMNGVLVEIID